MDCCNYGEYRGLAHAQYGSGTGWEGYGYAPLPYAPYAHAYYPPAHPAHPALPSHPAHDPYARYYRYDYNAHHVRHNEHATPMDYGAYALKEARARRALARREQRAHLPAPHLPLPQTPPLECGLSGRGLSYCDPPMWPHYQSSVLGGSGWSGTSTTGGGWAARSMSTREQMRYNSEYRLMKSPLMHPQTQAQDGRSTPYSVYEDPAYNSDNGVKTCNSGEISARGTAPDTVRTPSESFISDTHLSPPKEKRPPVVPLPAFQQAFGSTEIGRFAEAFTRTEVVHEVEDSSNDNFVYESFQEWDNPPELQWTSQSASREIKCEDNY